MSKIEWTDQTWNPVTGCNKVSRGCKNCYAEVMHKRLFAMKSHKYSEPFLNGATVHHDSLQEPFKWKKPRMVFVNSMSDLFHEYVSFDFIDKVFDVMAITPQHTYQILTKRPERMLEYFEELKRRCIGVMPEPLPNVWIGTSVENQEQANKRIPHLQKCPAAIRFLSCEPLVGHVVVKDYMPPFGEAIDWVIAGGESGPKAQPMHPDWVRSLRDQCASTMIPFFFKQWGAYRCYTDFPIPLGEITRISYYTENNQWQKVDKSTPASKLNCFPLACKVGKKEAGNLLDGKKWEQFPEREKVNQQS